MENTNYNIALVIDGDNISSKYLEILISELKSYGKISYKRIYGDFTTSEKQSWKNIINEYGLIPMQQFACITGKNTTDFALVIDTMDILYSKNVDCICIVSSDSDFNRLVTRLKENNIFVIGAGESKANKAFIKNYDRFIMLDKLFDLATTEKKEEKQEEKQDDKSSNEKSIKDIKKEENIPQLKQIFKTVDKIIGEEDDEEGWSYIATVIQKLYKEFPEFSPKLYNSSNIRELFKKSGRYEIKQTSKKQTNDSPMIRIKPQKK
jgi:uncharacterized protein (TIGR00288 family)